MAHTIETSVARVCERFKGIAQDALNSMLYAIEDLECMAEANPGREDIQACLAELKATNKANENANWVAANKWSEHFDNINSEPEKEAGEKSEESKPATDAE